MLAIELVEGCNFSCYFCRAQHVMRNTYIDTDLFKRLTDEANALGITTLKLTPCRGEPFLHPDIYELLEYACAKMDRVMIFTNATPINVDKLSSRDLSTLDLNVSFYGDNPNRFIELTRTNEHMYKVFHKKLDELNSRKIPYTLHRRDVNYEFDYDGGPQLKQPTFDPTIKCTHHQHAKIYADGRMSFCNFTREELPGCNSIFFADMHHVSLKEALTDPIRYKFYDTQHICQQYCRSYDRKCGSKHSIATMKLLMASKARYIQHTTQTDDRFDQIVTDIHETNLQSGQ